MNISRLSRSAWRTSVLGLACLAVLAARAGEPVVRAELHGRLSTYEGLRVLELWGTPAEAAYAHGKLLAEPIVRLIDDYMLNEQIVPSTAVYETLLVPSVHRQFEWTAARIEEVTALARGLGDALGAERAASRKLGRALRVDDLMAANALADWYGLFCSTFSAWGALTKDSNPLTARNLDYPAAGGMEREQLVVVYRGDGQSRGWVGVSWPGMLGVYTAMNADGVTMLMHDAPGLPPARSDGFTPRSLTLRLALEAAAGPSFLADVQKVLSAQPVLIGNNIHVSAPPRAAQPCAVVFEYDAADVGSGVTVRLAESGLMSLPTALWCTNTMCLRRPASDCQRSARLGARLTELAQAGAQLDVAGAFAVIGTVRRQDTLHTVVCEPQRRMMHVWIPALTERPVEFRLDEWLRKDVP